MKAYENYIEWKNWSTFGQYSRADGKLFQKEFHSVPIAGRKVLDIGFGSGAFMKWASDQGADIEGIELQEPLIRKGTEAGFTVYGSINEVKGKNYDVITLFDVLEHIDPNFLPDYILEISKILKDGGYLFARIPNCQSFLGLINQFGDVTHRNMLSGLMLSQLGACAGLRTVYIRDAMVRNDSKSLIKRVVFPLRIYFRKLILSFIKVALMIGSIPYTENVVVILRK